MRLRRRLRPAGRRRPDCGRHRRCRREPRAASTCRRAASHRVGGLLARVVVQPLFGQQHLRGVRRVLQDVVLAVALAALDLGDFLADRDHGVDEAVQLGLAFRFGRLDHQRAGHREAHGGRVEAVVHQALGDVLGADAAGFLERTHIQDALVRHAAVAARVQHRIVVAQAGGDVVRIQDRDFGGAAQTVGTHQRDVHERDRQDAGRTEGAAETGPTLASPGSLPCSLTTPGRYGARCARTATGRGRRRRAGCRRSCAGSGARRRNRTCRAGPRPPWRSCWRRPGRPGRRPGAPVRRSRSRLPRTRHAWTGR